VIPPDANAGFVAAMEDVLETYQKPRDPERPLVCLDETSKQLIIETRKPISAKPGQPARYDYEYQRNGVANLFMMFAPLEGWRHVEVTDCHAAVDYAKVLKDISDVHFPAAEKIVLVQDNLSTHTAASLYAAFPAPEARRLVNRFEWHCTPKHGSWLDMAESELAVPDPVARMEVVGDPQTLPPVQQEVQEIVDRAFGKPLPLVGVERMNFYQRARESFAVVATSERRFYGCFLIKKGVLPA